MGSSLKPLNSPLITELSLRHAANSGTGDDIEETALGRASQYFKTSGATSATAQTTAAIGLAAKGLLLAVNALSGFSENLKHKRIAMDKEIEANIATFVIRNGVEYTKLSNEEKMMKSFIELKDKFRFPSYFSVKQAQLKEGNHDDFYSILPFYSMSDNLEQPIGSQRRLDIERAAISLYLKTEMPGLLANFSRNFYSKTGISRGGEYVKSAWKGDNYLNDLRLKRAIVFSLGNLLWNVLHPVEPGTGLPCTTERCIEVCQASLYFINNLLDPKTPPYIHLIEDDDAEFVSFLQQVERQVKFLHRAYCENKLYGLDIKSVIYSANNVLRTMDQGLLQLVYSNSKPDKLTAQIPLAQVLACKMKMLNDLLMDRQELFKVFSHFPHIQPPCMNHSVSNALDVLIMFLHMQKTDRNDLYTRLDDLETAPARELKKWLQKFKEVFVDPIKTVSEKELKISFLNRHSKESEQSVLKLTASRLLPLISLVIEDFRSPIQNMASQAQDEKINSQTINTPKQIEDINQMAAEGNGYYKWSISPFIGLSNNTGEELDQFPKHQYRFTKITHFLGAIGEIVINYRSFLQYADFQTFLIKCLHKVDVERRKLASYLDGIRKKLGADPLVSRFLANILNPMTVDLNVYLEEFARATENFKGVVSAEGFSEAERSILAIKLSGINEEYTQLFNERSGIMDILQKSPKFGSSPTGKNASAYSQPIPISPTDTIPFDVASNTSLDSSFDISRPSQANPDTVFLLTQLIESCYQSMSAESQKASKGRMLQRLKSRVAISQEDEAQMAKEVIYDLCRVVACPLKTNAFFKAGYGSTRSAKVLIKAVLDLEFNQRFPLASIIFNNDTIDIRVLTTQAVIAQLNLLRTNNQWEKCASEDTDFSAPAVIDR